MLYYLKIYYPNDQNIRVRESVWCEVKDCTADDHFYYSRAELSRWYYLYNNLSVKIHKCG
jgi:hypothetical protein